MIAFPTMLVSAAEKQELKLHIIIPLDKIKLINMQELIYMGFQVGHPIP